MARISVRLKNKPSSRLLAFVGRSGHISTNGELVYCGALSTRVVQRLQSIEGIEFVHVQAYFYAKSLKEGTFTRPGAHGVSQKELFGAEGAELRFRTKVEVSGNNIKSVLSILESIGCV